MVEERFGISRMAELSGLSKDTLRWYERQGMLPAVDRGTDGYRHYDERTASFVILLARLRETGMPVSDMRAFARLIQEGAASHGRRIALLEEHRERIRAQQQRLAEATEALDEKVNHYEELIAAGLDCLGDPVPEHLRPQQRDRGPGRGGVDQT